MNKEEFSKHLDKLEKEVKQELIEEANMDKKPTIVNATIIFGIPLPADDNDNDNDNAIAETYRNELQETFDKLEKAIPLIIQDYIDPKFPLKITFYLRDTSYDWK